MKKSILLVHRTSAFDRNLEELRRTGGSAAIAADKAELLIRQASGSEEENLRKQFRFTRNGENRISYCGKYDLGCGYRLAFIRRGNQIAFLFIGSHDDCFRWISRNKGLTFEFRPSATPAEIRQDDSEKDCSLRDETQDAVTDEYEEQLMRRIDDRILRKIFSGFAEL
jgi:hypothetical protein